jgi:hypothetical protein
MATGGSIEAIDLGGTPFSASSDADLSIFLGGFSNEALSNGDGTGRVKKTRMPWKVTGVEVTIDWSAGDMQLLKSKANGPDFPIGLTLADGTVLRATGNIQGEFTGSTASSTVTLELAGPGDMS